MSVSGATGFEFEGVEKKLEIDFIFTDEKADPSGLRTIAKDQWVEMLKIIRCSILSHTRNDHFDAYVLSESSLFVYPSKLVLKTCGTTRTLLCLDYLLQLSRACALGVEFVFFSRKNFKNPHLQHFPHTSFDSEIEFLNQYFNGQGYTFGSTQADHWNLYIADYTDYNDTKRIKCDQTIEIMMTDLDRDAMQQFFKDQDKANLPSYAKDVTRSSGIADILPGAVTDEFMFDPCGYSVNGLIGENYFTIHVTPEQSCSFVSFETNAPVSSYKKLVEYIVSIFKPGNFQVSLVVDHVTFAGAGGLVVLPGRDSLSGFKMKSKSFYEYEHYSVAVCQFCKV